MTRVTRARQPLRVGLSTCPNDTFAFHGLLSGAVRAPGIELEFELADVEELNQRMAAGELDVAKTSAHAMLALAERVWVLSSGSALGFGVGPLLLAAPGRPTSLPLAAGARVLAPGRWTTASLLFRLLCTPVAPTREGAGPAPEPLEQVLFSSILPRLAAGSADYGVCIHEARFTWQEHGVGLVADLGTLWEQRTGAPLPLGGICARRDLGRERVRDLARLLRRSIEWGHAHREECLQSMRRHAQEASDAVLWSHVELYVNDWTLELGAEGRRALELLASQAREAGLLAPGARLEVA